MDATVNSTTLDSLQAKLDQGTLTAQEVAAGARECFLLCQHEFFERRIPRLAPEQITRISDSLIEEVYEQEHVNPHTASPVMLRHVINILNGRFEFMQDPQIAQHHHEVITTLFAKLMQSSKR
jgi:hypothetical protein